MRTRCISPTAYDNTRVIKYDMNGKSLLQWGEKGSGRNETRPGYWLPSDRKLCAANQGTHKILGYDLDGHFLYSWGS